MGEKRCRRNYLEHSERPLLSTERGTGSPLLAPGGNATSGAARFRAHTWQHAALCCQPGCQRAVTTAWESRKLALQAGSGKAEIMGKT
jgi:hypothetical protein